MSDNKFIELEGADRAGKTLQCELLKLRCPDSRLFKYPSDREVFGAMIRKILATPEGHPVRFDCTYTKDGYREQVGFEIPAGDKAIPYVFQLLQSTSRLATLWKLRKELDNHTVFMDRYSLASIAYSLADGLPEQLVMQLYALFPIPDVSIVLDGEVLTRDESPDRNEARASYQERVREIYRSDLVLKAHSNVELVERYDCADYTSRGKVVSGLLTHDRILKAILRHCPDFQYEKNITPLRDYLEGLFSEQD